ncbi:transposon Tf2-9 polyprotein [Trichonephila clavipes]|nr:transposon Tf2-9 polyprotein [Trichonephila clavipes]
MRIMVSIQCWQQRNPHYVIRITGVIIHLIKQQIAASPDGSIRTELFERFECKCSEEHSETSKHNMVSGGQAIETYVTQLKTLASTCEFAEQENGLIRDRIVLGIKDSGLQERLLRENNLNIEKANESSGQLKRAGNKSEIGSTIKPQ